MTVEALCRELDSQGWPVSVSTMNGMIGKKRSAVTITEVFAFARALEVAPLNLLFPFDNRQVEVLPGHLAGSAFEMAEWFIGEDRGSPFLAIRDHEKLVSTLVKQNAEYAAFARAGTEIAPNALLLSIEDLSSIRRGFRAGGIALPPLRDSLEHFIDSGVPLARRNAIPLEEMLPITGLNTEEEDSDANEKVLRIMSRGPAGTESTGRLDNEPPA